LITAVGNRRDIDFFIFYSYRYHTAAMGARAAEGRAVFVPTAEDDPAIRLGVFGDLFRSARGLLYLTPEEQELIEHHAGVREVPSAIIGSGVSEPAVVNTESTARFDLPASYVLYAGRIDRNKGVDTLFRYYAWLTEGWADAPTLVLAGHQVLDIPVHPKIRYVGYVTDEEKSALLRGAAVVIMPSALESLSILVLEAWSVGTPVLVNARCRVLEGQCRRSNGGLYYRDLAEFAAMLRLLTTDASLRHVLGESGRAYVAGEYSWAIAAERTEALLVGLQRPFADKR
jgi:glycosyltransferase involved in cell wall biosynthesis